MNATPRNIGNFDGVQLHDVSSWEQYSILIHLPPLATLAFQLER
jgi:hypothetical protein